MTTSRHMALALSALMLSACASVPRDGIGEVQRAMAARDAQLELTANDERVRAMLQDELTADEAVAIAAMNSPRLQATLADLGVARAELIEASTVENPLVEFEYRFPAAPYHPYEIRLAQSLVSLIQLPRRRAIGRAAYDAATMRVTTDVLRFAADVRTSWYDLVAARQRVAISRTAAEAERTATELALRQHEAGNITDLDLENEQALYEQAKLDQARDEQRMLVAHEALVRAMAVRDGAGEWRVPDEFPPLPPSELDQPQLEQLAAARRLDIDIARREVDLAKRRVPIARLAALGEIEIDGHYEREPSGEHTTGPGISLPLPLFNTGAAARTRAEAEYLRARYTLDALLAESASLLRTAKATVAAARARVEYYRDVVVPRRRRITELTKLEHNAMFVGPFQLLQARQNELQAQRDYLDAQLDYWSARTDLDRAVNGVAEDTSFDPATDQSTGKRFSMSRGGH